MTWGSCQLVVLPPLQVPWCTHFHLLDLLTERGTVTGTVLSGDADLLSAYITINIESCIARAWGVAVRLVILAVCGWGWFDGGAKFEAQIRASVRRLSGILGRRYPVLGAPSLSERACQTDQPSPT